VGSRSLIRLLAGGLITVAVAACLHAPAARAASPSSPIERPPVTWLRGDGNYTKASRTWHSIRCVVVHATEGPFWGSITWLKNERSHGSAHFIVGRDGRIVQIVHRSDIAWHSGNATVNRESIGIEHVGITDDPAGFTLAEYRASARLTAWVARNALMPVDRAHIIAHSQVPDPFHPGAFGGSAHHTDPGPYWKWGLYLRLVRRYAFPERFRPLKLRAVSPRAGRGFIAWRAKTSGPKPNRVEFRVDGRLLWIDHRPPYAFAGAAGLNTATLANGRHVLETRAIAGRKIALARHFLVVRNRTFALKLRGLRRGMRVAGIVRLRVTAQGALARRMQLVVDGRKVGRDTKRPWALLWNTGRAVDGVHTVVVYARATDHRIARRKVTVVVRNHPPRPKAPPAPKPKPKPVPAPVPAPAVLAQSLADGQTISGPVDWQVQADNAVRVEFLVDAAVRATASTAPYSWAWDPSTDAAGEHTLVARAVGRDGRVAEAAFKVSVTPTSPPAP
jgi:N-acetyl-anhydromuramyl-L-alanine amidase AmpD